MPDAGIMIIRVVSCRVSPLHSARELAATPRTRGMLACAREPHGTSAWPPQDLNPQASIRKHSVTPSLLAVRSKPDCDRRVTVVEAERSKYATSMKHACIRCLYPNAEQMTTLDCHLRDHDYPRHDPYPDHPIGTCRKAILMQNPRMMQGNYSAPQDDHCAPQAGWCYAVTMMCLTQPPGCTRLPATSRFEPSSADTGTHLTHHRDATWHESIL